MSAPIRNERTGWRDDAVCGMGIYPPDLWFATRTADKKVAKAICHECEARLDCLADALATPGRQGIVAGHTPNQIAEMKRERKAA